MDADTDADMDADMDAATTQVHPTSASTLLSSFSSFLIVAIHLLLRHRNLYPAATFLLARAYNLPVYQSRHAGVCTWVRDAVASAMDLVRSGRARSIAFVVHKASFPGLSRQSPPPHPSRSPTSSCDPPIHKSLASAAIVERWIFDIHTFPFDALKLAETHERRSGRFFEREPRLPDQVNWPNVQQALRAALRRLSDAAETLEPPTNQDDCTFTLAVEMRQHSEAPVDHPQLWIPSEPHLQPSNPSSASALSPDASTTPIRAVRAGPLFFECYVEQA
ncbi:hypothetical protein CDD81_5912 [Ophiocordyceps australis]|uniref:HORMA domain-containing protein n=1 Tax=Ophiocordyceps australis TaxID=1399860 RepID=A0A2C5YH27_9HYPO|nr:hypothetical protein CDD81_5912 [Ophiocordyceps australis]